MSFLNKKIKDFFKKSKMGAIALIAFFGLAGVAFGQIDIGTTIPIPTEASLSVGEIWGYGWMGTGIINQSSSQGGGGWLKFNCSPENCRPDQDLWGVNVVMDEDDARYGWLYGEAWSNNYGWLVFEPDLTSSCWEANPAETANSTARVIFNGAGAKSPIVGWGKFVAGDDSVDGWDGCVSFSGVEYGVLVDTETGSLSGWAWGGPVVGWISFQNPECPFCDTTLIIDEDTVPPPPPPPEPVRGCTNPAATNYNPLATIDDGSCIVRPNNSRPNINLEVEPGQFFVGSGDYTIDSITWTSTNPSQIEPGSCKGFLTVDGGLSPTISGWSGVRPDPNSSISNIYLNYAENAGPGTVFEFLIKCLSTTGADVSDADTIIMTSPTVPTGPSPRLNLRIEYPETFISPGTSFEIIPADGLDVTLGWDGSSINWNSCEGTSQQLDSNGSDIGTNAQWASPAAQGEYNFGPGQFIVDMTSPNNYTTWYTLTCQSEAGDQTLNRSVLVCVSGSSCPQTGGGRPGYQEF